MQKSKLRTDDRHTENDIDMQNHSAVRKKKYIRYERQFEYILCLSGRSSMVGLWWKSECVWFSIWSQLNGQSYLYAPHPPSMTFFTPKWTWIRCRSRLNTGKVMRQKQTIDDLAPGQQQHHHHRRWHIFDFKLFRCLNAIGDQFCIAHIIIIFPNWFDVSEVNYDNSIALSAVNELLNYFFLSIPSFNRRIIETFHWHIKSSIFLCVII